MAETEEQRRLREEFASELKRSQTPEEKAKEEAMDAVAKAFDRREQGLVDRVLNNLIGTGFVCLGVFVLNPNEWQTLMACGISLSGVSVLGAFIVNK